MGPGALAGAALNLTRIVVPAGALARRNKPSTDLPEQVQEYSIVFIGR